MDSSNELPGAGDGSRCNDGGPHKFRTTIKDVGYSGATDIHGPRFNRDRLRIDICTECGESLLSSVRQPG